MAVAVAQPLDTSFYLDNSAADVVTHAACVHCCDDVKPSNDVTQTDDNVIVAGRPADQFRNYATSAERVVNTYKQMHTIQCVDFVQSKIKEWCSFNHGQMTVMEALDKLNDLVDESDPDVDMPNIIHAYQTAERIRADHPDKPWFQLTGLIHDLGKLLTFYGEPQYCVVGDTFPVGCAFSDKIVFGAESFEHDPDKHHPLFSTKLGIYQENVGLRNVLMSWGHDEYMFRVLQNHAQSTLPYEAGYIIRFHSFYPWHTAGDYDYLCDDYDRELLKYVKMFNKYDLYTKADKLPDIAALKPYYQSLIDQYLPGKLDW